MSSFGSRFAWAGIAIIAAALSTSAWAGEGNCSLIDDLEDTQYKPGDTLTVGIQFFCTQGSKFLTDPVEISLDHEPANTRFNPTETVSVDPTSGSGGKITRLKLKLDKHAKQKHYTVFIDGRGDKCIIYDPGSCEISFRVKK